MARGGKPDIAIAVEGDEDHSEDEVESSVTIDAATPVKQIKGNGVEAKIQQEIKLNGKAAVVTTTKATKKSKRSKASLIEVIEEIPGGKQLTKPSTTSKLELNRKNVAVNSVSSIPTPMSNTDAAGQKHGNGLLYSEVPIVESNDVSSSDAETQADYDEEEDDDDEEELEGAVQGGLVPMDSSLLLISPISPLSLAAIDAAPSPSSATSTPPAPVYNAGADHDPSKKIAAIVTRTTYGVLMASGLITIVLMGQIYIIILVFICQAIVFSELTGLFDAGYANGNLAAIAAAEESLGGGERERMREERRKGRRAKRDRWSRMISWYFFAATNYFLYGESLIYYFKHILTFSFHPSTFSFAQHHRLISFGLYIIGFVGFVADLKRAQLRRQFGLFGWIHMSLLLVVVSSHFIVNNILEGLIWFWVPASLVIVNDIAAYVCGMAFGRHQLIKLSPKKTVEGFVGAFFVTIIFAYFWGTFFMSYNYMICPVQDLATNVFSEMKCHPNRAFVWREFMLPVWATGILSNLPVDKTFTSIPWAPFQLHSIVLAIFASLVAPFGGFFASGFKRAFNIKDFGASIPGHGGLTDRMDCQFLMGLFTYVYYASLIRDTHVTVSSVFTTIATALTTEQQLELLSDLTKLLATKGIKSS